MNIIKNELILIIAAIVGIVLGVLGIYFSSSKIDFLIGMALLFPIGFLSSSFLLRR